MNTKPILPIFAAVILTGVVLPTHAQEISIPDPGLKAAIREALQKPGGPLTEQDLLTLTNLNASRRNVGSIAGLETARNLVWKAAWVADHPEAVADRSVAELPLHVMARSYTAEAMHEVALGAAECFGAMGVMRDMPLQKYVHDSLVLLYAADNDSASRLQISEALAGYERPAAA